MIAKLCVLSLGLLLIALPNAQLNSALAQSPHGARWGHSNNNEDWGFAQAQGYQNGQQQFNYGNEESYYPGSGSYEEANGGRIGGRHGGGRYVGRSGGGFRGHHHRQGGFRNQPSEAEYQQPGSGFRQTPGSGFRQTSGSGFRQTPGYGHRRLDENVDQQQYGPGPGGRWSGGFRNGNNPLQPPPIDGSYPNGYQQPAEGQFFQQPPVRVKDSSDSDYNQQGNTWQPRPGMGTNYPNGFQEPGNALQPRPYQDDRDTPNFNYQTPGSGHRPLQPRPFGDSNIPTFNYQTPGNDDDNRPLQPRPYDQGDFQNGFQQPGEGQSGNALQPRPSQTPNTPNINSQRPGNSPLQPRPNEQQFGVGHSGFPLQPLPSQGDQGSGDGALQPRPSNPEHPDQQSSSPLQPRPTAQQTSQPTNPNVLQRQPTSDQPQTENDQVSGVLQPRPSAQPEAEQNIQANIASIFNTHDYNNAMATQPSEASQQHGSRDPKNNDDFSIDGRNLFVTPPICTGDQSLRNGRCRSKA